jgi:hypothetical protein
MTIAACYLCPEGLVLGADSTSSAQISPGPGLTGFHFYNHNQKLFEIGENSTLGVITWGAGSLGPKSHREIFALVADEIKPKTAVGDVARRLSEMAWPEYQSAYGPAIQRCKDLAALGPHDPAIPVAAGTTRRTENEQREFDALTLNLHLGFCVGGYCLPSRSTTAFEIIFDPHAGAAPAPKQLPPLSYKFWGVPKLVQRLIFGADEDLKKAILASGKWNGTEPELVSLLEKQRLGHHLLPIRDAVDFVHTCIYSTIKAMKFSSFFQICGGPIELAVITSDRRFRWVRHKAWDSAIDEGDIYG